VRVFSPQEFKGRPNPTFGMFREALQSPVNPPPQLGQENHLSFRENSSRICHSLRIFFFEVLEDSTSTTLRAALSAFSHNNFINLDQKASLNVPIQSWKITF